MVVVAVATERTATDSSNVHPQVHGRSFPHAECICILYINNKLTKGTEKNRF
jgi:hypothetical protein